MSAVPRMPQPRVPPLDPVEAWKAIARARVSAEARRSERPRIGLHVSAGFVLVGLLLGARNGPSGSLAALCILASMIGVHELPRALYGRARGRSSRIAVSIGGGYTHLEGPALRGGEALVFESIGSVSNAAVALAAFLALRAGIGSTEGLGKLALAHAAWAVVQVLPIVPFRAGRTIAKRLAAAARFRHATLSVSIEVTLAIGGALAGVPWLALLATLASVGAMVAVFDAARESRDETARLPVVASEAEAALSEGDPASAALKAQQAVTTARSSAMQTRLWRITAWAAIGQSNPFLAHQALGRLPAQAIDLHLVAAYLACCNRVDEATKLLDEGRAMGYRSRETSKLLIDLRFRTGNSVGALSLACEDRDLLSPDDWAAIRSTCVAG